MESTAGPSRQPQPVAASVLSDPDRSSHDEEPQSTGTTDSRLAKLNKAEKYWVWKAGVRVVICVINIIAIGCAAWLMARTASLGDLQPFRYGLPGWDVGSLVTFIVSFIWCFVAILIPLIVKRSRPLHPGIAVGIDLVFWLVFIVIGLFTLAAVFEISYFGADDSISEPYSYSSSKGYYGSYYLAPNNTWVYNITSVSNSARPRYNYTTGEYDYPPLNTTGIVRSCTPYFTTCDQQDRFINEVWRSKSRTMATTLVVDAVAWLDVLFHFVVFVWACVDTHRVNARRHAKRVANKQQVKEQIIADRVIAGLEEKGLISVIDGIVHPARSGRPELAENSNEPGVAR